MNLHGITVILVLAIIVLNVFDYISTTLVLSKGRGRESNPAVTWAMAKFGKYWWVVKLVFVPIVWGILTVENQLIGFVVALLLTAVFAYVVWNNYMILWRHK